MMETSGWIFLGSLFAAALLLWRRVGINLGVTSVLLCLMLAFHGPAYLYYTRVYGPETAFYETILSAAPDVDVVSVLDLALAATFASMCLGVLWADLVWGVTRERWKGAVRAWSSGAVGVDEGQRVRLIGLSMLLVFVMMPFVVIDAQVPKVLNYFTADLGEFEKIALRREGGGSSFYLYNLLLSTLFPYAAFCMVGLWLIRARFPRVLAIALLVLVALGKAATLSKAPVAIFALQCALVGLMLRQLTLSWKTALGIACMAASLFIVMAWVANPVVEEFIEVLDFLFYRLFMIANESLLEYFAAIPSIIDHSWGLQISWVAALLDEAARLPTYWLVGEVHRGVLGSTTTAMFLGDAWGDFAWFGVVIASFVAGALTRWIDIQLIVLRGKSVFTVAGLALGQYGVFVALSTSLQTAMLTGGLVLIVPIIRLLSNGNGHSASDTTRHLIGHAHRP